MHVFRWYKVELLRGWLGPVLVKPLCWLLACHLAASGVGGPVVRRVMLIARPHCCVHHFCTLLIQLDDLVLDLATRGYRAQLDHVTLTSRARLCDFDLRTQIESDVLECFRASWLAIRPVPTLER